MSNNHPIVVAGAGIGGLMTAISLALRGFRVTVLEAANELEPIGAGIQLSPNASRILIEHGLGEALRPYATETQALRVVNARSGKEIVSGPLADAVQKHGAPFWVVHRGDLQAILLEAVGQLEGIDLHRGAALDRFGMRDGQLVVGAKTRHATVQMDAAALIGADGVWSAVRDKLGDTEKPKPTGHTAWRALIPAHAVPEALRQPVTTLWLGSPVTIIHYVVQGGEAVNLVAIVREDWNEPGWAAAGDGDFLTQQVSRYALPIRTLVSAASGWQKWPIVERSVMQQWGVGPVTLLGDAAHAMRPHLAQGAAMALEDAVVLATEMAARPDDLALAMRAYENKRRERVKRVQKEAARNGGRYAWSGVFAAARNFGLARMGGDALLRRYDWIYGWRANQP
ncbi:3-hydroxybenzoate 6-hydroxylase 1 [Variibacter gotjawalensis]|uniref:3-hydroxybenzoate 6-hydroxylase 1 n=1 Tax=Variibacter gotjawalensis TaxID=1333996 RepID=A0A0S3PWI6_9BRAD|nr:FAD-dependent monooxygenase [Variibacter gotjawalensis]NIK45970.1 salicylate hydroxylase [Variibacter gotjawalensis]RZS47888.1 salicylate hydroxylase [Variibacter gotjawalensis]BAT60144.1 3-hydroxybenzoate 6-hydroxylase 1 [Variibacter gotjawalensis]